MAQLSTITEKRQPCDVFQAAHHCSSKFNLAKRLFFNKQFPDDARSAGSLFYSTRRGKQTYIRWMVWPIPWQTHTHTSLTTSRKRRGCLGIRFSFPICERLKRRTWGCVLPLAPNKHKPSLPDPNTPRTYIIDKHKLRTNWWIVSPTRTSLPLPDPRLSLYKASCFCPPFRPCDMVVVVVVLGPRINNQ